MPFAAAFVPTASAGAPPRAGASARARTRIHTPAACLPARAPDIAAMPLLVRAALVAALLAVAPSSACAQDSSEDARNAQARAIFEAGRVAFEAANYEDALRHFREAYQLSGRWQLLYNIGIAADRLRRDREALEAFEEYLRRAPADAPQRPDAEARVRVLRRTLGTQQAQRTEAPPPERTPPQAPPPENVPRTSSGDGAALATAGLGMMIGGGVVLAGGIALLAVGQVEASTVENAPMGTPYPDVAASADNAYWMRTTGWVVASVGLAVLGTGIALFALAPQDASSASEGVELRVRPNGLSLAGRFP